MLSNWIQFFGQTTKVFLCSFCVFVRTTTWLKLLTQPSFGQIKFGMFTLKSRWRMPKVFQNSSNNDNICMFNLDINKYRSHCALLAPICVFLRWNDEYEHTIFGCFVRHKKGMEKDGKSLPLHLFACIYHDYVLIYYYVYCRVIFVCAFIKNVMYATWKKANLSRALTFRL
jgi:hypothetical protein